MPNRNLQRRFWCLYFASSERQQHISARNARKFRDKFEFYHPEVASWNRDSNSVNFKFSDPVPLHVVRIGRCPSSLTRSGPELRNDCLLVNYDDHKDLELLEDLARNRFDLPVNSTEQLLRLTEVVYEE